jgi:hypothetical protein
VARRNSTLVPSQALAVMNSPFVHEQAARWADKAIKTGHDTTAQVEKMFLRAIGRLPSTEESRLLVEQVQASRESSLHEHDVWKDIALIIFSLNDFIFLK